MILDNFNKLNFIKIFNLLKQLASRMIVSPNRKDR